MSATEHRVSLPDRYRVLHRIASGGMATVWAAEDGVLGRIVAIKILAPQIAVDPDARVRFEREARTAAQVSDHPNVVTIYDIGEHGGNAFIVMECFGGGTVADRLREGRQIPRSLALRWLAEAAAALDAAHAQGIVHRDVKPANLLLDEHDRLAVGDFGIARMAEDIGLTSTGQVLGTAAYLSPEQALGERATPASDLYSLAVVAYELLTGERPFRGEHAAAQARQHVEAAPPRASRSGLPAAVDPVFARGLAKDPRERWLNAAALVGALQAALDSPADPVPVATAPTRRIAPRPGAAPLPAHRPRFPVWAAGVAALAVAGLVLAVVLAGGGDDRKPAAKRTATSGRTSTSSRQTTGAAPTAATPAELNAQGAALIRQGRYSDAIPVLTRAVEAGKSTPCSNPPTQACLTNYAYPLFNLAHAYRLANQPSAAITLLQQRLQIDDQRAAVEQELALAQQAAGVVPRNGNGKGKAKKPKKG
jgi:eukaryotic-like serine/threonine-protein kinase